MSCSKCRLCGNDLHTTFIDLGMQPLSNAYTKPEQSRSGQKYYPLHAFVCSECFLVQLEEFETPDAIFSDYAYFSSYSTSWLKHAEIYVEHACERFSLNPKSKVIEVASNDGYLLQYFTRRGVPALGIEPAANVAAVAQTKGVPTEVAFFGRQTAMRLRDDGQSADLIIANNVLAHVPEIRDFVAGFSILLKSDGVATIEFPHLLRQIQGRQFDQVYHEHFSYLSLSTVARLLLTAGLRIFDVEELSTHGGSLRVFACHQEAKHQETEYVAQVLAREDEAGLADLKTYSKFKRDALDIKLNAFSFLATAWREGKTVCGYGAAAKGNTFLNYLGVGPDLLSVVADRSPYKQHQLLPGSQIPIVSPERLKEMRPDYVLILPWNLQEEIVDQMKDIRSWGGKFAVAIPEMRIF